MSSSRGRRSDCSGAEELVPPKLDGAAQRRVRHCCEECDACFAAKEGTRQMTRAERSVETTESSRRGEKPKSHPPSPPLSPTQRDGIGQRGDLQDGQILVQYDAVCRMPTSWLKLGNRKRDRSLKRQDSSFTHGSQSARMRKKGRRGGQVTGTMMAGSFDPGEATRRQRAPWLPDRACQVPVAVQSHTQNTHATHTRAASNGIDHLKKAALGPVPPHLFRR